MDVEIKVSFGESEIDRAKKVFGLDPGKAEEREIWSARYFLEISVLAKADPERAQRELRRRAVDGGLEFDDGRGPKTTIVLKHLAGEPG